MRKIVVAGIGTDVGKTVVSAILTLLFKRDYWKPIQCGNDDRARVEKLLKGQKLTLHPPPYSLKPPLSPHHAARLENVLIKKETILLPKTPRTLIIEGVGGILVPLTSKTLAIDLFKKWSAQWVIVSKHYLGSINHTLLTIEALRKRHLPLLGIIFNGEINPDSESAILEISKIPLLGRLLPEAHLNQKTLHKYAKQWQPQFL